jgi:hypothetical protein
MTRSSFERRLRDELAAAPPPRSADAERRAWQVVAAAHAERTVERPRRAGRRVAVVLVAAVMVCALVLSPAGAKVSDWIGDVVSPPPEATRSALASLPADGRLLVVAESGSWIVRDDGARRRLGAFRDATWSPGGLFVAGVRGRELSTLEPDGDLHWTLVAPARVSAPRWSPDGFRIAYRSGSDLYATVADNTDHWLLARGVHEAPPAWRPGQPDNRQVLAYASHARIYVVRADRPRRLLYRTPPGPEPRELWWGARGRRLVAVSERAVRTYAAGGRLLRDIPLPRGLRAAGSALSPDGRRLALIATGAASRSSRLLLLRTDRSPAARRPIADFGPLEGLTCSIDGRVLVVGLPRADQWLFLRMRGRGGLLSVKDISAKFAGGRRARSGAFPRPAGWCYPEPNEAGLRPCSSGAAP